MESAFFNITTCMKRKKLFYIPGIISLIGLPILVYFLIPSAKPSAVIKIYLLQDTVSGQSPNFSKIHIEDYFYGSIATKRKIEFDIGPDSPGRNIDKINSEFNLITNEIRIIKKSNDTNTVIKVSFGKLNTYGDIIWLLNQPIIYQLNKWALLDGTFYMINFKRNTSRKEVETLLL
jgi:hypothetical protein